MHSYSVKEDGDSGVGLANGLAVVTGVCTVAVVLVLEVALVGFVQPLHYEVVPYAVCLGVPDSVYCLVQQALDNP